MQRFRTDDTGRTAPGAVGCECRSAFSVQDRLGHDGSGRISRAQKQRVIGFWHDNRSPHICTSAYVCRLRTYFIYVKAHILYTVDLMKARSDPSLDLLFRALADRTRLRLLNLIADKEICVCYFVEILKISQPKISRHLAYLRRAGIVAARRQGRWMHYRLLTPRDAVASAILKETLAHLRQMPDMEGDLAK